MLNLVREGEEDYIEAIRYRRRLKSFENFLLSGDAHARRPLHKMDGVFFFFSFCRSVVGTSGLAPSATSGPPILQVLREFENRVHLFRQI